jgi:quercetin dioxygenase-like cupin family protein
MITRRDIFVALAAATCTACVALAVEQSAVMGSSVFDWKTIPVKKTEVGELRSLFKSRTATLDELEVHITTLNPGQASHPPHKHPNEEIVIVKEGTVEAFENGVWTRLGPGSVIFSASNQMHGIRNVGDGPATYHVINWSSPGMLAKGSQP